MVDNVNESGFFDNPNDEVNTAEKTLETVEAIHSGVSAIHQILTQNGGALIDKLHQSTVKQQQQYKRTEKENKAVLSLLYQQNKLIAQQTKNTKTQQKATETVNSEKQHSNRQAPIKNSSPEKKQKQRHQPNKKELLPNGWQRDKNGRVRDKKGRFVTDDVLATHGIKNPKGKKPTDTEEQANNRRLLDSLDGIKDSIESPENLDPMLDAFNELKAPLGTAFSSMKGVSTVIGRGMGKAFGENPKSIRWRDRFFSLWRRTIKNEQKYQIANIDWLRRIWKKDPNKNGGWLSKLIGLFFRFPVMLLSVLGRGLLSLFGGKLVRLLKGAFSFKGLGGIFGKLGGFFGKAGKGLLKKIPLLGSLVSLFDMAGGFFDDSRDEEGRSNRGKRIGGGVGTLVGGALGSFLGPVGTIVGAMIGDFLGEKIGAWLADLNWKTVGDSIQSAWNASIDYLKTGWQDLTNYLKGLWDNFSATEIGQSIISTWDDAVNYLRQLWDNFSLSDIAESINKNWNDFVQWLKDLIPDWLKNGATQAVDNVKEFATGIIEKGKAIGESVLDKGKQAYQFAKDKVMYSVQAVGEWFDGFFNSDNIVTVEPSEANANETVNAEMEYAAEEKIVEHTKSLNESSRKEFDLFGSIHKALLDIYQLLQEKLTLPPSSLDYAVDEFGNPIQSLNSGSGVFDLSQNGNGQFGHIQWQDKNQGLSIAQAQTLGNEHNFNNVKDMLVAVAKAEGVPVDTMVRIAGVESGFITNNKNAMGSAGGLYQFIDSTWNDFAVPELKKRGIENPNKLNGLHNAIAGAAYMKYNARNLAPTLQKYGQNVDTNAIYMSHFLGDGGAKKFYKILAEQGDTPWDQLNLSEADRQWFETNAAANIGIYSEGGKAQQASYLDAKTGSTKMRNVITQKGRARTPKEILALMTKKLHTTTLDKQVALAEQTHGNVTQSALGQVANVAMSNPVEHAVTVSTSPPTFVAPQDNSESIQQQVAIQRKQNEEKPTIPPQNNPPSTTTSVDPALQFLTQDVSERNIAHIVTGGIGGIAMRGKI